MVLRFGEKNSCSWISFLARVRTHCTAHPSVCTRPHTHPWIPLLWDHPMLLIDRKFSINKRKFFFPQCRINLCNLLLQNVLMGANPGGFKRELDKFVETGEVCPGSWLPNRNSIFSCSIPLCIRYAQNRKAVAFTSCFFEPEKYLACQCWNRMLHTSAWADQAN